MTVAIATMEQDVWPPRVQVSVTGLTIGDQVYVYRSVAAARTLLRAGSSDSVTDPAFIVVDAELPFGVPVSYVAVVNGTTEYASSAATYDLPGGKVALTDAITGAAAEVVIGADGGKNYSRQSARMRVGGKNVVVVSPAGQPEGSYELVVETAAARRNLLDLLANATGGTVQIRQAGPYEPTGEPYDGIDAHLAVDAWTEKRFSQDGSDPKRLITIEYAETDGWAPNLEARGFTLGDVATYFGTSGTLADIDNFFPAGTLLSIAQADWSV